MRLSLDLGLGSIATLGAGGGYSFTNAEAEALVARFTTPPNDARKALIDTLVGSLKTAGAWEKMDAFYMTAAADGQAARQNWIADQYNLSAFSSPVFTADRGYTPDGASSYLDSGFNPTTAVSPKFTQDSAHMAAWHLTDLANGAGTSFDVGNLNSRIINSSTLQTGPRANLATPPAITEDYSKDKLWCRQDASIWEYYNSVSDSSGGSAASVALTNFTFGIGRTAATSFGLNQCACYHFGSNLTAAEALAAFNAKAAYLTAVGAI